MRKLLTICALLFLATAAHAQLAPTDPYGGNLLVPAPKIHPHRTAVTCTQSNGSGAAGTILLCTFTNYSSGSVYYQPTGQAGYPSNTGAMTNWQVIISSPALTFNIATSEPFIVDSTTTMDTPFVSTGASASTQGAAHLTSFNPSTGVMTLTSPNSVLVTSPTAGFIRPGHWSVQNVTTPHGTGSQFVDPDGYWNFVETAAVACTTGCTSSYKAVIEAKYGSTTADLCNAAKYLNLDLKYAGFNGIGENSDGNMQENVTGSCSGANFVNTLPSLGGLTLYSGFTYDSEDNRFAQAPQPPHDLSYVVDQPIKNGSLHDNVDYADPNFNAYVMNALGATSFGFSYYSGRVLCYESTFCDLVGADDTDYMTDGVADQFWNPAPGQLSPVGVAQGYIAAISPLHISYQEKAENDTRFPFIFPNDTNYLKLLSSSAPSGCYYPTTTIPGSSTAGRTAYGGNMGPSYNGCSWPDFVRNWFGGSLSTMNLAFGITPGYDTFGTDETVVSDGVPSGCTNSCVGNGSISVFTFTLNTTVTPGSIHINITPPSSTGLPEMMVAGDCPDVVASCPTWTGEFSYEGNIVQQDFTLRSTWYPIASQGSQAADPAEWTEIETSGGETQATTAPTFCGTVGCTTTDGSVTWTNYDSAIAESAGGFSGTFCQYTTGSCHITFYNALASGTKITVSYTTNGWACQTVGGCSSSGGRGVADEDGNGAGGSTLVGTNSAALVTVNPWAASTSYPFGATIQVTVGTTVTWQHQETSGGCTSEGGTGPTFSATPSVTTSDNTCLWVSDGLCVACSASGATYPAPNANALWGIIAHAWVADRVWFYYHTVLTAWADFFPDQLVLFPNAFQPTPNALSLQTAYQMGMPGAYVNGMVMDTTLDPNGYWKWKEFQTWFPGAVFAETYYDTTQSWTGGCDTVGVFVCASTMAQNAQNWYNHVNNALTHGNQNGTFNFAGVECYSCQNDIQKHGYGIVKDVNDNLLNGVEDVITTGIPCNNGFGADCGGEPDSYATPLSTDCATGGCFANWTTPYGYNTLLGPSGVIAANDLWLLSSTKPIAPTRLMIFVGELF